MDASTRKSLRAIGHKLKPVVTVSGNGLSEAVSTEINRALDDHELIKIKLEIASPAQRKTLSAELCEKHGAELVQSIGKIILILRRAEKPKANLSNLSRI